MKKGDQCKFRRRAKGGNRAEYYQPGVFRYRLSRTHGIVRITNKNGTVREKTVKLRNVHRDLNREAAATA